MFPDITAYIDGPQEIVSGSEKVSYRIILEFGRQLICRPFDYPYLAKDVIASIHSDIYGEIIDELRQIYLKMHQKGNFDDQACKMVRELREKVENWGDYKDA